MNFALQVAKKVLQVNPTVPDGYKNVVCSPVSLANVLSILAAGSDGATRVQLLRVMDCDMSAEEVSDMASMLEKLLNENSDGGAPDISYVNALWMANHLVMQKGFQQLLKDVYKIDARAVDFVNEADKVVIEANLWADKQSKGLIKQILSIESIKKDTMMIISNVLYFNGVWACVFKPEDTVNDDFHLLNGNKVRARFMSMDGVRYKYTTMKGCNILEMPYRRGNDMYRQNSSFSMYIFLPEKKDGLPDLVESIKLDANLFKNQIKLEEVMVNKLHIPKFDFECEFPLSKTMEHLGLTLPFDPDHCELTKMVISPKINDQVPYVSEIYQKCRIQTNEEGTKAVAFTYYPTCPGYSPPPPCPVIDFVANHPFMFMIKEDFSDTILFIGTLLDPTSTD